MSTDATATYSPLLIIFLPILLPAVIYILREQPVYVQDLEIATMAIPVSLAHHGIVDEERPFTRMIIQFWTVAAVI